jgi:glycosyltransferase involved in cell wall biosynthesis
MSTVEETKTDTESESENVDWEVPETTEQVIPVKKLRLVMIGESFSMPSGFGQQMLLIAEGLSRRGYEIIVVTSQIGLQKIEVPGVVEWAYTDIFNAEMLDSIIHKLAPDVVLGFWHTGFIGSLMQLRGVAANCPFFFWLPYEGNTLPKEFASVFRGMPQNRTIHLSKFAQNLWAGTCDSDIVIPHGVDNKAFCFDPAFGPEQNSKLRRKWAERLRFPFYDDTFIVLCLDRNIWHKRWDAVLDYCSRLERAIDKPVRLLCHARKVQPQAEGHPPGYDIPHLEKVFKFDNKVAYTDFEWQRSLEREELAELLRICDIRITCSQGEGFGIPTIEAAAVGCLQVVNNQTTMPELLGADNPMLVESAMTEDKVGSLWAIPDVREMVDRTIYFINNPVEAQQIIKETIKHVEQFEGEKVCQQFDTLFRRAAELPKGDAWYTCRWGMQNQVDAHKIFRNLGTVISKIKHKPTVLDVGAFTGTFVDVAAEFSLGIVGIEWDEKAIQRASSRARMYIKHQSPKENWPAANVVVLTDQLELLYELGGVELIAETVKRLATYQWALIRFRPAYKWGVPVVNPETVRGQLEAAGMIRREDIENIGKEITDVFEHEVWQPNGVDSTLPAELAKSMKERD